MLKAGRLQPHVQLPKYKHLMAHVYPCKTVAHQTEEIWLTQIVGEVEAGEVMEVGVVAGVVTLVVMVMEMETIWSTPVILILTVQIW
jgi:hypothetical protein